MIQCLACYDWLMAILAPPEDCSRTVLDADGKHLPGTDSILTLDSCLIHHAETGICLPIKVGENLGV